MFGRSVQTWRCSQFWIASLSLVLGLFAFYAFQQYAVGAQTVQETPPVIAGNGQAYQPPEHVDCSAVPCLALTFDDGPNPTTTPIILKALEQADARATFFVEGAHVPGNEALLRRMYQDGFEIGNHSWNHPDLTKLTAAQVADQVNATQQIIMAAGVPAPTLFRPPFGSINTTARTQVPLTIAFWSADPRDWRVKEPSQVLNAVLDQAGPGKVVDMHDTSTATADAIVPLLAKLKTKYQLVTFSELLNLNPGQRGEYSRR